MVTGKDVHGDIYPLTTAITKQRKQRSCLHCGDLFDSPGPGFRFCSWCKNYLHQTDEDDPHETQVRVGRTGRVDSTALSESAACQGHMADDFLADGGWDDTDEIDEPTMRVLLAM